MQAVILAAGKGTRLLPLTEHTPKGLVDIGGKPLLLAIFEALPQEIDEIVVIVGHLGGQIKKKFGASWNGRKIRYVTQDPLDGTGTALHAARKFLHDRFLVVNGDDLYALVDLERLIAHPVAILTQTTKDRVAHGVLVDEHKHFLGLESDPPPKQRHVRVCGAYVLDERFFAYPLAAISVHGSTEFSLPHTLVEMAKDIPVKTEEATFWQPVGTPAELARVRGEA